MSKSKFIPDYLDEISGQLKKISKQLKELNEAITGEVKEKKDADNTKTKTKGKKGLPTE